MACRQCIAAAPVSNSAKGGCAGLTQAALGKCHVLEWGRQHRTRLDVSATVHVFARSDCLHNNIKVGWGVPPDPAAVSPAVSACLGRQMLTLPQMGLRSA